MNHMTSAPSMSPADRVRQQARHERLRARSGELKCKARDLI